MSQSGERGQVNAFFCTTPLQVLVSALIERDLDPACISDIFILNDFASSQAVVDNLRQTGRFRRVQHVKSREFMLAFYSAGTIRRRAITVWHSLTYRRSLRRYVDFGQEEYTDIYFSHQPIFTQLAIMELLRREPEATLHMYDDGTASYTGKLWRTSAWRRSFNVATRRGRLNTPCSSVFTLSPELAMVDRGATIHRIRPVGAGESGLRRELASIFGLRPDTDRIPSSVVFFEQPIDRVPMVNVEMARIANQILPPDAVIKLHPLSSTDLYEGMSVFSSSNLPWEIVAMNGTTEDKALVGVFSTALMTSKILFDEEPVVVFLFDLPELKSLWDLPSSARDLAFRFRSTYRHPERVLIPTSIDEARRAISDTTG